MSNIVKIFLQHPFLFVLYLLFLQKIYFGEKKLKMPDLENNKDYVQFMRWADEVRTLGVRANADTKEDMLQKEKEDGLLSLGTMLIILGSIGYMFVWSLDYHILWGQHIENAWEIAALGMTMEIGMVMLFGIENWSGVQCFAAALASRGYGNSTLVKITSAFAGLHVVNHFYTIFNFLDCIKKR